MSLWDSYIPTVYTENVFVRTISLTVCTLCSLLQQCSSTCAGGFQRRVVVCQDENGYPANSCEDRSRPSEQRSCESGPCPQWIYGNWGEVRQTPLYCCLHHITAAILNVLYLRGSFAKWQRGQTVNKQELIFIFNTYYIFIFNNILTLSTSSYSTLSLVQGLTDLLLHLITAF